MNRLLALGAVVFVFQQLPAFSGNSGTWIDLVTPFVVIGTAAWALQDARLAPVVLGLFAVIVYVDGHGIHLAANDIGQYETVTGKAEDTRHFWDERFGHIEWHLGYLGLLAALSLADPRRGRLDRAGILAAVLFGWTLFANTVEGEDWFLTLGAAGGFTLWAIVRRTRTLAACALGMVVGAALIGVWAAWQGGVPQFSDVGWL